MATRLQLRQALAELQHADLAQQAQFAVERLLKDAGDASTLDFFLQEALRMADCAPSTRRARYRLAAAALRSHAPPDWGPALLHLRDRLVERVGAEDSGGAAAELQALSRQLTAAMVQAYCRSQLGSLGYRSKGEVPRDWLSRLLITPLLRAACRWALGVVAAAWGVSLHRRRKRLRLRCVGAPACVPPLSTVASPPACSALQGTRPHPRR